MWKRDTKMEQKSHIVPLCLLVHIAEKEKRKCIFLQEISSLTHNCLVDPSIFINWTNSFPILGMPGVLFDFYSILNRYFC